jgi:hypothetical protein
LYVALTLPNTSRAAQLFTDFDEALEYMEDFGFDVERGALLERYGHLTDAAAVYLAEGRIEDATRVLKNDKAQPTSHDRLESTLLECFWRQLSIGMIINSEDPASARRPQLPKLLSLAAVASSHVLLSVEAQDEV